MPPARGQPGASSVIRPGLQLGELSTPAGIARSNQRLVITQHSGEVDQDRRTDCASCPADCLPTGRGSGVQRSVCCHPGADKPVKSGSGLAH